MDWGQEILLGLIAVFALFLIVQLVSVIIGISITRNITAPCTVLRGVPKK